MSLSGDTESSGGVPKQSQAASGSQNVPELHEGTSPKSIFDALELLYSLREKIMAELKVGSDSSSDSPALMVPLNTMGFLRIDRERTAHVLWVGPKQLPYATALDRVSSKLVSSLKVGLRLYIYLAGLIDQTFREHGFITEKRPLKARSHTDQPTRM